MSQFYTAGVGHKTLHFNAATDAQAERVVCRWVRLYWARYKSAIAEGYPGSLAEVLNEELGWSLYAQRLNEAGVIQMHARLVNRGALP
jgi:hypothetical protein